MKHTFRKFFYLIACAIPVYISAAGLGTPISTPFSEFGNYVRAAWAECSHDPTTWATCLYNLNEVAADVESYTKIWCKENPHECNITVTDVLGDAVFGETEPNNFIHQANRISLDQPVFGQISAATDVDWFTFNTFENNTAFTIWFAPAPIPWLVTVTDRFSNVLAEFETSVDVETNFRVQAANVGQQYIVIRPVEGSFSRQMYQMMVTLTGAQGGSGTTPQINYGEVEPNDTLYTANPIRPHQTIVGQSSSPQDIDWFMIETHANNTYMNIWFEAMENYDTAQRGNPARWDVSFTDHAGNVLSHFVAPTADGTTFDVQAGNAGNYYIRVRLNNPEDNPAYHAPYRLAVHFRDEFGGPIRPDYNFYDAEREPNDTFSQANILDPSTSMVDIRGHLNHRNDFDLFRIDSAGNETINIEICPDRSSCYPIWNTVSPWAVYLFDGAKVNDAMLNPYTFRIYDGSYGTQLIIPLGACDAKARSEPECLREPPPVTEPSLSTMPGQCDSVARANPGQCLIQPPPISEPTFSPLPGQCDQVARNNPEQCLKVLPPISEPTFSPEPGACDARVRSEPNCLLVPPELDASGNPILRSSEYGCNELRASCLTEFYTGGGDYLFKQEDYRCDELRTSCLTQFYTGGGEYILRRDEYRCDELLPSCLTQFYTPGGDYILRREEYTCNELRPSCTAEVQEEVTIGGFINFTYDHPYFLYRFGQFGNSLFGIIDGQQIQQNRNSMSLGLTQPGTYFVGVSSLLEDSRDNLAWEVISLNEEVDEGPDKYFVYHINFTSSEYTLRITRTQLSPAASNIRPNTARDSRGSVGNDVQGLLRSLSRFH